MARRDVIAHAVAEAIWGQAGAMVATVDQMTEAYGVADALAARGFLTDDGAAPPGHDPDGGLPGRGPEASEVVSGPAASSSPIPRRFQLYRHSDVSGISGTGVVAWGVQFPDRSVALRWPGAHPSTVAWNSVADVLAVHGHAGATEARWLDQPDDEPIDLWPAEGGDRCDTDD